MVNGRNYIILDDGIDFFAKILYDGDTFGRSFKDDSGVFLLLYKQYFYELGNNNYELLQNQLKPLQHVLKKK